MKEPARHFIIDPPAPGDNRPRNAFGVLIGFGEAYNAYYRKRDTMNKSREVAEWLKSLGPHILQAEPCIVAIGNDERPAARYTQHFKPLAGAPNQAEYDVTRYYVLGERPRAKTCFPYAGGEWYVAAWFAWHSDPAINDLHPFGPHFLLSEWSVPSGQPIDYFEREPYRRVPMAVSDL